MKVERKDWIREGGAWVTLSTKERNTTTKTRDEPLVYGSIVLLLGNRIQLQQRGFMHVYTGAQLTTWSLRHPTTSTLFCCFCTRVYIH
jgi:hypothetical protein